MKMKLAIGMVALVISGTALAQSQEPCTLLGGIQFDAATGEALNQAMPRTVTTVDSGDFLFMARSRASTLGGGGASKTTMQKQVVDVYQKNIGEKQFTKKVAVITLTTKGAGAKQYDIGGCVQKDVEGTE